MSETPEERLARAEEKLGQLANETLGLRFSERNIATGVTLHHKWPAIMDMIVDARRFLAESDPEDDEE